MNKINILYKEMTKKRKNCNNIQENKKEPGELSLVARTQKNVWPEIFVKHIARQ